MHPIYAKMDEDTRRIKAKELVAKKFSYATVAKMTGVDLLAESRAFNAHLAKVCAVQDPITRAKRRYYPAALLAESARISRMEHQGELEANR